MNARKIPSQRTILTKPLILNIVAGTEHEPAQCPSHSHNLKRKVVPMFN